MGVRLSPLLDADAVSYSVVEYFCAGLLQSVNPRCGTYLRGILLPQHSALFYPVLDLPDALPIKDSALLALVPVLGLGAVDVPEVLVADILSIGGGVRAFYGVVVWFSGSGHQDSFRRGLEAEVGRYLVVLYGEEGEMIPLLLFSPVIGFVACGGVEESVSVFLGEDVVEVLPVGGGIRGSGSHGLLQSLKRDSVGWSIRLSSEQGA